MPKKSRQKLKYLENEKSFYDEIKSVFHHFCRAIIEANKKNFFLEGGSPTLNKNHVLPRCKIAIFSIVMSEIAHGSSHPMFCK